MKIIRNLNRDWQFYPIGEYSRLFREHNESMRKFRLAHDEIDVVGTKKIPAGWLLLPAIQETPLTRFCLN